MKTYKIEPAGSSKIAAYLCMKSMPGEPGEAIVKHGGNQDAFAHFVAEIAFEQCKKGKSIDQLALIFENISACNASAALKALGECNVFADEETALKVKAYVKRAGQSSKPAVREDVISPIDGKVLPFLLNDYWRMTGAVGGKKIAPDTKMFD